jgi:hypothetical protein
VITNKGKDIIAKYLIGITPAYASYMAFGCGAKPLTTGESFGQYSTKDVLDFEMFRVPISSRGYVEEDGFNKIVFTSELPTTERYEITEIGIFSAGGNPDASGFDSRPLLLFTEEEQWQYGNTTFEDVTSPITTSLDYPLDDNIIATALDVFQAAADNSIFFKANRNEKNERCRFFNNMIFIKGDYSQIKDITNVASSLTGQYHIQKTGLNLNLSQNSLSDQIKIAFSLVNKDAASYTNPDSLKIILEFIDSNNKYARCLVDLVDGAGGVSFNTNRYFAISKTLGNFVLEQGFSWATIKTAKIYSCVVDSGNEVNTHYIAFDAIRFDNVNTVNPLYGLVGYTVVKNADGDPITKSTNTNNYVEFRMALDIGTIGDIS